MKKKQIQKQKQQHKHREQEQEVVEANYDDHSSLKKRLHEVEEEIDEILKES